MAYIYIYSIANDGNGDSIEISVWMERSKGTVPKKHADRALKIYAYAFRQCVCKISSSFCFAISCQSVATASRVVVTFVLFCFVQSNFRIPVQMEQNIFNTYKIGCLHRLQFKIRRNNLICSLILFYHIVYKSLPIINEHLSCTRLFLADLRWWRLIVTVLRVLSTKNSWLKCPIL